MENRELITIKTPIGGVDVVLKAWLTGREKRDINSVLFQDTEFNDGKYSISGSKLTAVKDAAIRNVVVSVNGVTEDILNILLDMRSEDYDFIVNKVDELTSEKKDEELKKK